MTPPFHRLNLAIKTLLLPYWRQRRQVCRVLLLSGKARKATHLLCAQVQLLGSGGLSIICLDAVTARMFRGVALETMCPDDSLARLSPTGIDIAATLQLATLPS